MYTPTSHEDYDAWYKFSKTKHRWAFNKLEVALRQGLEAGPAGSAPFQDGFYISRPIYNLYGMGVDAFKFAYGRTMKKKLENYSIVPSGHFWCEWLEGDQVSIDYVKNYVGEWEIASVMRGVHATDNNLTRFSYWEMLDRRPYPLPKQLPLKLSWLNDADVDHFNVEMRGDYVTEIHLRMGNSKFEILPVGTKITPVWDKDPVPECDEYWDESKKDIYKYRADDKLKNARRGFAITYPES